MRKIYLICFAVTAVFAFSAIAATGAFAEEALWLFNENEVTNKLSMSIEGNLELIDTKTSGGEVVVNCSGFFVGTVGPGSEDEITAVLNLAKEEINTLGGAKKIACTPNAGICEKTSDIELQPENLPWLSELELMSNGKFLDKLTSLVAGSAPGWNVLCLFLGLNLEDLCEGDVAGVVELMSSGELLNVLSRSEVEAEGEAFACSQSKGNSALLNGSGVVTDSAETGELDVSSP